MIYYDGKIFPDSSGWLERLAPGKIKGQGVFETMAADNNKILQLKEHLGRLCRGLKILNILSPYTQAGYRKILYELLSCSRVRHSRIRLMVWRYARKTHICIVATPYKPFSARTYQKGFRAAIALKPFATRDLLFQTKSIRYKKFLDAYEEARQKGYDEAVLLHQNGYIVEASRANVFLVCQGRLVTPSLKCGCLHGITRRVVLKLAKRMKISCRQTCIYPRDLYAADEIFLTNSLMGIMPVTRIDHRKIGRGAIGSLTKRLKAAYHPSGK